MCVCVCVCVLLLLLLFFTFASPNVVSERPLLHQTFRSSKKPWETVEFVSQRLGLLFFVLFSYDKIRYGKIRYTLLSHKEKFYKAF